MGNIGDILRESERKPKNENFELGYLLPFYSAIRFHKRVCDGDYGTGIYYTSFNATLDFYFVLFYNLTMLEGLGKLIYHTAEFIRNI
jgi:hypothetical protein